MGGTGSDAWWGLATDSSGNLYRAGYFTGTVVRSTGTFISAGSTDWIVEKVTPSGNILWTKQFGGTSGDRALSVATNGTNVAISGNLGDNAGDGYIVVLSCATGATQWTKQFGSTLSDEATAVAMDTAGSVYMTGYFRGAVDFGTGTLTVPFTSDLDVVVAEYNSSGTVQWAEHFCDTGNGRGYGIAVNGAGSSIAVVGNFSNTMDFSVTSANPGGSCDTAGALSITAAPSPQANGYVVTFNGSGVAQWVKRHGATSGNVITNSVALDSTGAVIVTGDVIGAMDLGGGSRAALGNTDIFLARYNSSGTLQWDQRLGGTSEDHGYSVAIGTSDGILLTGYFTGTADLGLSSKTSAGSSDAYVSRFTSAGTDSSVTQFGGSDQDVGRAGAVSSSNRSAVCGYFNSSGSFAGTTLTSNGAADGWCAVVNP